MNIRLPATLALLLALLACGRDLRATEEPRAPPAGPSVTNMPALWFPVGEELIYRIYWGPVPVGTTRVTTEWVEEEGRRLVAIRYRTRSNKVIEKIYPVDDFIESLVDPAKFLPVRFTKKLSEGRYHVEEVTTFDHARLTAHWISKLKNKAKDFAIEADTRDIVSLMYYLRSAPFVPGENRHIRVMADEKIYDLWVKVGKVEGVNLPAYGKVDSFYIEPKAAFQGLFLRQGKAWLWVSTDERRLCTKMVGSARVASIRVVLCEVRGPGTDFWVRRREAREGCKETP